MTKPTYEEFCSAVVQIVERGHVGRYVDKTNEYGDSMPDHIGYTIRSKLQPNDVVIYYDWSTGGLSGGNCWGDTASYYVSDEKEPEDNPFVATLELYSEDITYLKFRKISKTVLHEYTHSYYEYYGNRNDVEGRAFIVRELYEGLFGDA